MHKTSKRETRDGRWLHVFSLAIYIAQSHGAGRLIYVLIITVMLRNDYSLLIFVRRAF